MTTEEIVPLVPYILAISAVVSGLGVWWIEKRASSMFISEPNHSSYEKEIEELDKYLTT